MQYVGAGFDLTNAETANEITSLCSKNYGDGGILLYTDVEQLSIRGVNFRGRSKDENFIEMVGYLFELGYDLALSHRYNVSRSPGFKNCGVALLQ